MAPVALHPAAVASLMDDAREGRRITIDVAEQVVVAASGERFAFALPAAAREALLNGWDEIEVLLNAHAAKITAFESRQRAERPWLYVQD